MPTRPPLESFMMKSTEGGARPPLSSFLKTEPEQAPDPTEPPKEGLLKRVGKALIESERGFGESIAGAIAPATKEFQEAQESQRAIFEQAGRVVKTIQKKRLRGEDTTGLSESLRKLIPELRVVKDEELIPAFEKTTKQILGEAAGVAIDIASFGALPGAAKAIVKPASGFVRGAIAGAKQGAKYGGAFGTAQGIVRSLQEDDDFADVITEGVTGGAIGAITGGALGGITGGITGKIQRKKEIAELLKIGPDGTPPPPPPPGAPPTPPPAPGAAKKTDVIKYTTDTTGKVIIDKNAKKALSVGIDPLDVQFIKNSKPGDRPLYREMYNIADKASQDKKAIERPAKVAGREILARVRFLMGKRSAVGKSIGEVANKLPKEKVDITDIFTDFADDLGKVKIGIGVDKTGKKIVANFSNSIYKNQPTAQKHIQDILDDFAPTGRIAKSPADIFTLRQRIFKDLKMAVRKNEIDRDFADSVIERFRSRLEEPLEKFGNYKALAKDYAKLSVALRRFTQILGKDFRVMDNFDDFSREVLNMRAGEVGFRILGNASALPLGTMRVIDNLAKQHGLKTDTDIINQFLFADFLEDLFGTQASRSFSGQTERGIKAAVEGVGAVEDVARGRVVSLAARGIRLLRSQTPTSQKRAVEKLIGIGGSDIITPIAKTGGKLPTIPIPKAGSQTLRYSEKIVPGAAKSTPTIKPKIKRYAK